MSYFVGETARLSCAFSQTSNAQPVDPSTVSLIIKSSAYRRVLVYGVDALVRDAQGLYHYDYLTDIAETVQTRWEGTGAAAAAAQGSIVVARSNTPP